MASELCVATGIGKPVVMASSENLATEVSIKWVLKMPVEHKTAQKKHLCRTSPGQREKQRCLCVKNS
jgi:hypothetical protein